MQENMGRLQAEERLNLATVISVGGGKLKPTDSKSITAAWRTAAGLKPQRIKMGPQVAGLDIGIGVRRVAGPGRSSTEAHD